MVPGAKRYEAGKLYHLDISNLFVDEMQPRKYFDPQAMTELKTSIVKYGVLQPVLVRKAEDDRFLLVSGERRYLASLAAGITTIPALLTHGDPAEISIVENLLREDLTAIEEAEAIDRLKTSHNYQLCDLTGILGKAESTICEILSLNKLPDAVKDDCRNDPRVARRILAEIAKEATAGRMHALYEKYKAGGLTRGEIRRRKATMKREAASAAPVDLGVVDKFAKYLDGLEVEKLDRPQSRALIAYLDSLRLAINRKLRLLKVQAETP